MKIMDFILACDTRLPVWVNSADAIRYESVNDIPDRFKYVDILYITLDANNELTIEV